MIECFIEKRWIVIRIIDVYLDRSCTSASVREGSRVRSTASGGPRSTMRTRPIAMPLDALMPCSAMVIADRSRRAASWPAGWRKGSFRGSVPFRPGRLRHDAAGFRRMPAGRGRAAGGSPGRRSRRRAAGERPSPTPARRTARR